VGLFTDSSPRPSLVLDKYTGISDISSTYVPVCRRRYSRHRATRGALSAQRPVPFWVSLIKEGKELALKNSQGFADDGMLADLLACYSTREWAGLPAGSRLPVEVASSPEV
jgi:hypothetical protein